MPDPGDDNGGGGSVGGPPPRGHRIPLKDAASPNSSPSSLSTASKFPRTPAAASAHPPATTTTATFLAPTTVTSATATTTTSAALSSADKSAATPTPPLNAVTTPTLQTTAAPSSAITLLAPHPIMRSRSVSSSSRRVSSPSLAEAAAATKPLDTVPEITSGGATPTDEDPHSLSARRDSPTPITTTTTTTSLPNDSPAVLPPSQQLPHSEVAVTLEGGAPSSPMSPNPLSCPPSPASDHVPYNNNYHNNGNNGTTTEHRAVRSIARRSGDPLPRTLSYSPKAPATIALSVVSTTTFSSALPGEAPTVATAAAATASSTGPNPVTQAAVGGAAANLVAIRENARRAASTTPSKRSPSPATAATARPSPTPSMRGDGNASPDPPAAPTSPTTLPRPFAALTDLTLRGLGTRSRAATPQTILVIIVVRPPLRRARSSPLPATAATAACRSLLPRLLPPLHPVRRSLSLSSPDLSTLAYEVEAALPQQQPHAVPLRDGDYDGGSSGWVGKRPGRRARSQHPGGEGAEGAGGGGGGGTGAGAPRRGFGAGGGGSRQRHASQQPLAVTLPDGGGGSGGGGYALTGAQQAFRRRASEPLMAALVAEGIASADDDVGVVTAAADARKPGGADGAAIQPATTTTAVARSPSAAEKKLAELRKHFADLPDSEELFDDFACAMHKASPFLIAQGRLYVTSGRLTFYSNILGYTEKFSIRYTNIAAMVKIRFGGVLPNAIQFDERDSKKQHVFHNFLSRDSAFDLVYRLWTDANQSPSPALSLSSTPGPPSPKGPDDDSVHQSAPLALPDSPRAENQSPAATEKRDDPFALPDLRLPTSPDSHSGTTCTAACAQFHQSAIPLIDEVYAVPLSDLWFILFSSSIPNPTAATAFALTLAGSSQPPHPAAFRRWFLESSQRSTNYVVSEWQSDSGSSEGASPGSSSQSTSPSSSSSPTTSTTNTNPNASTTTTTTSTPFVALPLGARRSLSYNIPLGAPIGSPQTLVTETLLSATRTTACVSAVSATPGVYLGDRFRTVVRLCLCTVGAAAAASTRLRVSYAVEFDAGGVSWVARSAVAAGMRPKVVEHHVALRDALRAAATAAAAKGANAEAAAVWRPRRWAVPAAWVGGGDEAKGVSPSAAQPLAAAVHSIAEVTPAQPQPQQLHAFGSGGGGGGGGGSGGDLGLRRRQLGPAVTVASTTAVVTPMLLVAVVGLLAWLIGEVRMLRAAMSAVAARPC
ncbi:hypothetical protein DFJ73DRAFT_801570 [Zopfochytrium polystomum]|nr:hypothetical protein DFJ73DRAFT_801570 [Zopfochytrium polystomum]